MKKVGETFGIYEYFIYLCNVIYNKQGDSASEFKLVDYPTMDDRCENNLKSSDRLKQES